jgi:hypothetical protein
MYGNVVERLKIGKRPSIQIRSPVTKQPSMQGQAVTAKSRSSVGV